jgi:hypothetical protein
MRTQATRCVVCFLVVVLITVCGCSPPTATVTGSVTYNGAPVDYGSVVFFIGDKDAFPAQLGAGGIFTVTGLPYGEAKIEVYSRRAEPGVPAKHTKGTKEHPVAEPKGVVIPEDYNDKDKSGLKLTIDRATVEYKIELKDPE